MDLCYIIQTRIWDLNRITKRNKLAEPNTKAEGKKKKKKMNDQRAQKTPNGKRESFGGDFKVAASRTKRISDGSILSLKRERERQGG